MENIGQIHHKYKIHEILNCDMTKERNIIQISKELFLIPNVKFEMKL